MNANVMKTNNGKLLMATVVVIAMLACCFVVAMPGASAAYDASEGTYADVEGVTFNPNSSDLQVSFIDENGDEYPWSTSTPDFTNTAIGSTGLNITKDADGNYKVTGTLMRIGTPEEINQISVDDRTVAQKGFLATGAPAGYDYGFNFRIGDFNGDYLSYYNSVGELKSKLHDSGVRMIKYINSENATGSNTYYISEDVLTADDFENGVLKTDKVVKQVVISWEFTLTDVVNVDDASDLQSTLNSGAKNVNVADGEVGNITLKAGQTVTLGSEVTFGTDAAFDVPVDATVNFNVPTNAKDVQIKITGGTDDKSTVILKNVTGSFTVTGGSVVLKDTINSSMEITTETTGGATEVVFQNAVITSNSVITLGDGITYSVKGDVRLYGKILSSAPNGDGSTDDGVRTITVDKPNSFTAYSGATIGKNVIVNGTGNIDVSSAMSTVTLNDDIESDFNASQSQKVVIADTLTIKSGYTMTILGELVINENCTLIIEDGAKLIVGSGTAVATGVTVNGVIEVEKDGEFTVEKANDVIITGDIISEGKVVINSNVTVKTGGSITIDEVEGSAITVNKNANFVIESGGELNVSSLMTIEKISNMGTITLDAAVLNGPSTISMAADGAVVNVISLTATDQSGPIKFIINDEGLVFEKNKDGTAKYKVESETSNAFSSDLNDKMGFGGIKFTEKVTSEKVGDTTKYSNSIYIAGNVSAINDKDDNAATFNFNVRGDGSEDGAVIIGAEDTLTLGTGVKMTLKATASKEAGAESQLIVDGNLVATADQAGITSNGEIYVNGMITSKNPIDSGINAFHYKGTDAYAFNYYTTLATALSEGATTIDFIGDVKVLENVTIPAGTRVSAEDNATMTIGSLENRDVIVTVADTGSIRGGIITVDGSLVFENNKRDNRADDIISDVQIDEEPKMTYTNIYTALDNAESGKVTITRDTVTLNQDITVKEGVTLVIPANTTVQMWNKVTLTVDGTVENSGKIVNIPGDNATVAGTFNPMKDGKTNSDAAKIVVNGAFKSMEYTNYDDAADGAVNYYIPGAYFQIIDTEGSWYWITPVEDAAAVAANVEDGIEIFGTVTVGDVTFAGSTEEGAENVVVTVTGKLTAGTVTLSRADLVVDGQYDGNVATAVGSIAVVNANNFTVADSFDEDDNEIMTLAEAPAQADNEIKAHSVTVSSGTVTVNKMLNVNGVDFEVASSATVAVVKGGTLSTDGSTDNDKLTVDGTLTVADSGKVDVGTLTVKGTFNVIPADAEQKTADGEAMIDALLVGIEFDDKTKGYVNATAASVSANAIDGLGVIVVSAESTVTGELIDNEDYTEFYVEDTLWITVYNMGGAGNIVTYNDKADVKNTYGYAPTDLPTSEFIGWKDSEGKLIAGETIAVGAPNYDKVYADIDYNVYNVVITLDNTVGSVAIDGQMLVYDYTEGGYILPGGQELTAGQHTVTYTLSANYEGTPTLTSQNVTVSGLTFTLDGDFKDSEGKIITYYLSLGGATLADQTVVIEGGNGGNGELGLTDYLLIILVILIVVMAIIVAMRLMRS